MRSAQVRQAILQDSRAHLHERLEHVLQLVASVCQVGHEAAQLAVQLADITLYVQH